MSLLETVERVRESLERNGRISYRMLRREFALDDDALEELIDEHGIRLFAPTLHERRAQLSGVLREDASRERELREAHRLYTEMGATGHAERVAGELEK